MTVTAPPAGWYDDPEATGKRRWWDGEKWTDVAAASSVTAAPIAAKKHRSPLVITAAILGGLLVLGLLVAVAAVSLGGHDVNPQNGLLPLSAMPAGTTSQPLPPADVESSTQLRSVSSGERWADVAYAMPNGGFVADQVITDRGHAAEVFKQEVSHTEGITSIDNHPADALWIDVQQDVTNEKAFILSSGGIQVIAQVSNDAVVVVVVSVNGQEPSLRYVDAWAHIAIQYASTHL